MSQEKNKGGRPKKQIDYGLVEKLSSLQCTQEEIASVLDISTRTLQKDDKFLRIYKKGMNTGKISLRRWQYKSAEKGNSTMLVWLGKQYLKQTDKQEIQEYKNETNDKLYEVLIEKVEEMNDNAIDLENLIDPNSKKDV